MKHLKKYNEAFFGSSWDEDLPIADNEKFINMTIIKSIIERYQNSPDGYLKDVLSLLKSIEKDISKNSITIPFNDESQLDIEKLGFKTKKIGNKLIVTWKTHY